MHAFLALSHRTWQIKAATEVRERGTEQGFPDPLPARVLTERDWEEKTVLPVPRRLSWPRRRLNLRSLQSCSSLLLRKDVDAMKKIKNEMRSGRHGGPGWSRVWGREEPRSRAALVGPVGRGKTPTASDGVLTPTPARTQTASTSFLAPVGG